MKFYERVIRDFGGYEKCKGILNQPNIDFIMNAQGLREHMLEYRRQHNIYEEGDKYVMLKLWHDDLMTVENGEIDEPWWNERIIRHATGAEIAAGRRL